jgi:hypothetical protein
MRRIAGCCIALVLMACGRPADKPADETVGEAPAMDQAPAAVSLADLAGTWDVQVKTEDGDSTVVAFQMVATADESGWTFNFPKRDPIPVRLVAVEGDSVVTEAGPYESVLRKGVQVSTRTVTRLDGDRLTGTTVATYESGPNPEIRLKFEGERAH